MDDFLIGGFALPVWNGLGPILTRGRNVLHTKLVKYGQSFFYINLCWISQKREIFRFCDAHFLLSLFFSFSFFFLFGCVFFVNISLSTSARCESFLKWRSNSDGVASHLSKGSYFNFFTPITGIQDMQQYRNVQCIYIMNTVSGIFCTNLISIKYFCISMIFRSQILL